MIALSIMDTFENLYSKFKATFIAKHGETKFGNIKQKVFASKKLIRLNRFSAQQRLAPDAEDFGAVLQSTFYFMFAGSDTSAMAQLIAIRLWNDAINSTHDICSQGDVLIKGEMTLKQWCKPDKK